MHGNIIVKTGLDKKSIAIRGIKRTRVLEHLDHMHIIEEEVSQNRLALRTAYDYEKVKGTIDYIITIPEDANIHVNSDTGDIFIHQVHGPLIATTGRGDITIDQPTNKLKATVTQQGNITINQPKSSVHATTNKGTILIRDSMHNVNASLNQGKIEIRCKTLPAKREVRCSTKHGNISLHLPQEIQCSLEAESPEGTITSTQPITIAPSTTILNNDYWTRVKQQIHGRIGREDASIRLYAKKGDIKLSSIM